MTSNTTEPSRGSSGIVAVLAALLGALIVGYGLVLVPSSALGGGWIVAIGLALALSGLVATEWAADRLGLAPAVRRRLSIGFAALAVVLLAAFLAINGMTFETNELEGSA